MDPGARRLAPYRSRVRLIALVCVLAIGVSLGLRSYVWPADAPESGSLGKLATAVGSHRLSRARLTGGFEYAKCQSDSAGDKLVRDFVCAGPPPTSWAGTKRLRTLASDLRIGGETGASSLDAHIAGIWSLVWGRVDDAVTELRDAVRRDPSSARTLNDLAVALTEFAEHHNDPSALIDAFVAADSAVRLDSTLKEAQFTQALLLERLYLRTDAVDAWNRYLRLDGRSKWAAEAREHLAALQPPVDKTKRDQERLRRAVAARDSQTIRSIVADDPSDMRLLMQTEFAAWGSAFGERDSAAARAHLDFVRAIAAPFRAVTGDPLETDALAAIDLALTEEDGARARALSEGHASLARGIDLFNGANGPEATAELLNARMLLAKASSPMTAWALLFAARAMILDHRNSALALLTAIRDSTPANYFAVRSSAAQYQGFAYGVLSDYVHMLAAYRAAVAENRTMREPAITLRVASWLAEAEGVLRGREAGWRTRYAALAATPRYPTVPQSLFTVFDYAAMATASDAPRLSLRFCDQSIRLARQIPDLKRLTYALRRRGELLARTEQMDSARANISAALAAANKTDDAKLVADVKLARAHVALQAGTAEAGTELGEVIDEFYKTKDEKELPSAYLYLAQSRASAGTIASARAAFDSATSLMQRQRATIADYAERSAFLDDARSVIDQIVAFHAGHSGRDAFEYFEGTRSRVLLEQLANSRGQSVTQQPVLAALQHRLTKDDIVLSYAVLPRELLVWIITQNRFEQRRVAVAAPELEELVDRFQRSMLDASGQPDTAASHRLYRLLVDSASQLQGGANLIVIPDRWLHFVPFVALRNPSTGRFLVRDHAVSYAPSATLLVSNLARPTQHFSHATRVLAIGNPAFDRAAFQLPYLPAAEGEARRIASLYQDQNPLTGKDATDTALETMAPGFDIIHFAGHAIVGRDAPQLSHLVLASDGHSSGAVFSTEIASWKLARTRLVILSGCNTADGKLSATEGASSLARAFFAAGVPAVVSSLWAIEDDDTADFFIAFHRRLVDGDPPSVALRETQIKWLGDGRAPIHPVRSWASFQLFGG